METDQKMVRVGSTSSATITIPNNHQVQVHTHHQQHTQHHQEKYDSTSINVYNGRDASKFWSGLLSGQVSRSKYTEYMHEQEEIRSSYIKTPKSGEAKKSTNNIKQLIKDCDLYTRKSTLNYSLKCSDGLLAQSGAKYLRQFLPPTNDMPGYAKLRILDSFTLTGGRNACNFTAELDGRHFFPLDFLKLRVIAEGVLDALGSDADKNHKPRQSSSSSSNSSDDTPVHEFLVSEARAKELAETRQLGHDFYDVLKSAFGNRLIAFAGDSTTCCLRHHLVSYLLAMNSDVLEDKSVREALDINETSGSLRTEEMFELLKQDCPIGNKLRSPYYGGRCAYIGRTSSCGGDVGCDPNILVDSIAVTVSRLSHIVNKGALDAIPSNPDQGYVVKELNRIETIEKLKFFVNTSTVSDSGKNTRPKKVRRRTILVIHGGFHYLNLFPARAFQELNALNLGHYQENMVTLLNAVRKHLGPDSLVIWATVGNVCDDKLKGLYAHTLDNLKRANIPKKR